MIRRVRITIVMARPAVLVLLALFTATGLAQAGHGEDRVLLAKALAVVAGFLLFSVACNDLADEAIDRINLPGDRRRPLATGAASRREFMLTGGVSAGVALAVSATLHWPAIVVTACGLALSAGYSLRPVRMADRGAVASLVLPACYVAVPYLTGIFAARAFVRPADLLLLAGLYVGFIGRILLKDSGTSGAMPCSASARSWSGTAGSGRAVSARVAGSSGRSCWWRRLVPPSIWPPRTRLASRSPLAC